MDTLHVPGEYRPATALDSLPRAATMPGPRGAKDPRA